MNEAKSRLVANVVSSFGAVFVNAAINLGLTPFMIHYLGLGGYGMVALVVSFTTYLQIVTASLADAVGRYVAIHFGRGELRQSNMYFNSALYALLGGCGLLVVPTIAIAVFFPSVFQVPARREFEASCLFFLVIVSSFFSVLHTPFRVSAIITHRFYLSNLIETGGRSLRATALVLCFLYVAPTLTYVGLSYLVMGLFVLIGTMVLARRLTPELKPSLGAFRWGALWEMAGMSFWIAVNQVGSLLFLAASFVVLNVLAGPEAVGRFGVIALFITLLGALGGACSTVFAPIAYEYIARSDDEGLVRQSRRAIRLLGLIMGCAIGLMCGLAQPALRVWLGPRFVDLWPLVWVLVGPWLFTIAVRPMFAVYRGLDKVKVPAIVTVVLGMVNVVASVLLLSFTHLGVYGVAISLSGCWLLKNLLFTPLYAAWITKQGWSLFLEEMMPGALMTAGLAGLGYLLAMRLEEASVFSLTGATLGLCSVYALVCYRVVLGDDDRALLRSFLWRRG